ncbi:MAG TPA: RNA polymerase sigma factor [Acholeplasmataceae bacterium]|nr:RNA polymerase sigma factor [Acholeplasmataceae bacterium]
MNLAEAIYKIKDKDELAFETIYKETSSSVYAIIKTIVKDHNITEDLMQDTYIKMIKSINSYNTKQKFKTWLLTIARNTAIDWYRKTKKEMLVDVSESEYLFPSTKSTVDYEYNANYFLSLLDDEEKEVVVLYAMEGFKHREIAKIIDKPVGTVTWIYNKAMKKLREHSEGVRL